MAIAKTKAERKPAKSANSEQRFTIHEIEQAKKQAYQAGYERGHKVGQAGVLGVVRAAGLADELSKRTSIAAVEIGSMF